MTRLTRVGMWVGVWSIMVGISSFIAGGQTRLPNPGDPLPGLSPAEFEEFRLGLDDFTEVETVEDGLGPVFNGTSCAVCHSVPAIGGTGIILETRAAYREESGAFRGLNAAGDTLMHLFSVPSHGCQEIIPDDVTVIAHRAPIPLFGAGLVEMIPDQALLALEDPLDRDGDGIRGRAALVVDVATGDSRVGRFGWKAQHATLLAFAGDAYLNEMGITNDLFAKEVAFGITAEQMRRCDPVREPEDIRNLSTKRRGIDNFESFMRFLAPVSRGAIDASVREGERIFGAIGCASCHVPALTTESNRNPLFDRKTVPLFSDLLLHDVGTGDGIQQAAARPEEIRTPALWGLRLRRPLLHDGSAATIEDAVGRHRQEADQASRRFRELSSADLKLLLAFLRSL